LTNLEQVSAHANPLSRLIIALTADVGLERLEVAYTQFTHPNCLNVTLHGDHTAPFTCVDVWSSVGSAREKRRYAPGPWRSGRIAMAQSEARPRIG